MPQCLVHCFSHHRGEDEGAHWVPLGEAVPCPVGSLGRRVAHHCASSQKVLRHIQPQGVVGAQLAEDCQTVVPLDGAEGILEIQAGNDVVWVLLEPGSDRHGHCESPLGGADAVLSVFQVEIKVRPGLGKEKVAQ